MFCTRCQNELPDCTCDDREERLRSLAEHPNFATDRCANCANHPKNCTCAEYVPAGGDA